ncbi:MAG TPA: FtsQ-type POTRA domain-containing protein [Candidatus Kryptonia bacterium]
MNKIERTYLNFVLTISAFVALFLISQNWKNQLTLDNVVVYDTRILGPDEIKALADLSSGRPLFAVSLSDVSKRVEKNPFVKQAIVVRAIPYDLTITIRERNPIGLVAASGQVLSVDDAGIILPLPLGRKNDLPVITNVYSSVQVGDTAKGSLMQAVKFLTDAKRISPSISAGISEVRLAGDGLVAYTTSASLPVFIGKNDFDRKLLYLQEFFLKLAAGGLQCSYVDLRYNGQIIVGTDSESSLEKVSSEAVASQSRGSAGKVN